MSWFSFLRFSHFFHSSNIWFWCYSIHCYIYEYNNVIWYTHSERESELNFLCECIFQSIDSDIDVCLWQRNHWTLLTYKSCSADVISKMKRLHYSLFASAFLSLLFLFLSALPQNVEKVNVWYGFIRFFCLFQRKKIILNCFFFLHSPYQRNKFNCYFANNAPFQWDFHGIEQSRGAFFRISVEAIISKSVLICMQNARCVYCILCMRIAHAACSEVYSPIFIYYMLLFCQQFYCQ